MSQVGGRVFRQFKFVDEAPPVPPLCYSSNYISIKIALRVVLVPYFGRTERLALQQKLFCGKLIGPSMNRATSRNCIINSSSRCVS